MAVLEDNFTSSQSDSPKVEAEERITLEREKKNTDSLQVTYLVLRAHINLFHSMYLLYMLDYKAI